MEDGKEKKFWVRVSPSRARSRGPPPLFEDRPGHAARIGKRQGCWLLAAGGDCAVDRSWGMCVSGLSVFSTLHYYESPVIFFSLFDVVTGPRADRGRVHSESTGSQRNSGQWRTGVWMLENLRGATTEK